MFYPIIGGVLLIYAAACVYMGKSIQTYLKMCSAKTKPYIFIPVWVIISVFPIFSLVRIHSKSPVGRILDAAGSVLLGVLLYLLVACILKDIIRLIFIKKLNVKGKKILYSVLFSLALIVSVIGIVNCSIVDRTEYTVTAEGIKEEYKIALISDIHLGAVGTEGNLRQAVDIINQEDVDLVCIAGDLINSGINNIPDREEAARLLSSLKSKYGTFMCPGNHDGGNTKEEMEAFTEECGITLLAEEHTMINRDFYLAGRMDKSPIGGYGQKREEGGISPVLLSSGRPIVVMDHNPQRMDEYSKEGIREKIALLLSGHTHRGQVFPANIVTHFLYTIDYGYYEKDGTYPDTIVSSGVGTWGMPMRIGSDSEIVVINIKPER